VVVRAADGVGSAQANATTRIHKAAARSYRIEGTSQHSFIKAARRCPPPTVSRATGFGRQQQWGAVSSHCCFEERTRSRPPTAVADGLAYESQQAAGRPRPPLLLRGTWPVRSPARAAASCGPDRRGDAAACRMRRERWFSSTRSHAGGDLDASFADLAEVRLLASVGPMHPSASAAADCCSPSRMGQCAGSIMPLTAAVPITAPSR
jgi:hypothetical protein